MNGRVEPRFFADDFVFRDLAPTTRLMIKKKVQPRLDESFFWLRLHQMAHAQFQGDPDVTTNGIREYAKGTGTVLSGCKADAIDLAHG